MFLGRADFGGLARTHQTNIFLWMALSAVLIFFFPFFLITNISIKGKRHGLNK
jgi:hypothetical protein